MKALFLDDCQQKIHALKHADRWREFVPLRHCGKTVQPSWSKVPLVNLSGNDYLGIGADRALWEQFLATVANSEQWPFCASSSRLLTGNSAIYETLEQRLAQLFGRAVLLFNSGYHANIGLLPALCDASTVILADKWVHASIIDGMRLTRGRFVRFAHQDFVALERLIVHYENDPTCRKIWLVSESIFSMDGDCTDLKALAVLRANYPKVLLYIDEAHAVGVRGARGLGLAEELGVLGDIDVLVGAFGKAVASVGGFVVCHDLLKQLLINTARPLIYSTNLPPINAAWTDFVWQHLPLYADKRQHLANMATKLRQWLAHWGQETTSSSHIVPVIFGANDAAICAAQRLQKAGFYSLPIRPPTVPQGTARLRLCLTAAMDGLLLERLQNALADGVLAEGLPKLAHLMSNSFLSSPMP